MRAYQLRQHLVNLAENFLGIEDWSKLRDRLAKTAAGSFAIKVTVAGLMFLVSVFLARVLGVKDFGTYVYAMAWANVLSIPSLMGLNQLLVREFAVFNTKSEWGLMRGLWRWANTTAMLGSVTLAAMAVAIIWSLDARLESGLVPTLWLAMVTVPLFTLFRLRQAAMAGLHHVVTAQLAEIAQILLLIAFIAITYLLIGDDINAPLVVVAYGCTLCIVFLIWSGLLGRRLPQPVKHATPVYSGRAWARSLLPLLFIGSMQIVNTRTDVIMLGAIKGPEAAGVYNVAVRGAELISFVMMAVNSALAPTIAGLYAAGNIVRLQRLITTSVRITTVLALPIAIFFIFFGYWYLLMFGQSFTVGVMPLVILSAGQIISVAIGLVGLLLAMTGHEREAAVGLGIGAATNIALNAALIPQWGADGAAIATTSSIIIWNVLLTIFVYRKIGIHSTVFGIIGRT